MALVIAMPGLLGTETLTLQAPPGVKLTGQPHPGMEESTKSQIDGERSELDCRARVVTQQEARAKGRACVGGVAARSRSEAPVLLERPGAGMTPRASGLASVPGGTLLRPCRARKRSAGGHSGCRARGVYRHPGTVLGAAAAGAPSIAWENRHRLCFMTPARCVASRRRVRPSHYAWLDRLWGVRFIPRSPGHEREGEDLTLFRAKMLRFSQ